jgi:hypothetical protein
MVARHDQRRVELPAACDTHPERIKVQVPRGAHAGALPCVGLLQGQGSAARSVRSQGMSNVRTSVTVVQPGRTRPFFACFASATSSRNRGDGPLEQIISTTLRTEVVPAGIEPVQ